MATVKPFRGIRPPEHLVERIESRPYDVLDSEEARQEAADNEMSLYHITKPEINFGVEVSEFDAQAYDSAKEQFEKFQERGWLVQDDKECYYIYAQTMEGRTQYGLVVCASVHDYVNGVIKKHELTRKDKEENRMKHVRACNANIEPVFFAYPDNTRLNQLIMRYAATKPLYDFVASVDGFRHQFWVISQPEDIKAITDQFASMPALYIADGHHRTAAAALVGAEKGKNDGLGDGEHEHDYFMAVCFQASQLTILDYNRVIKDLNGMSSEEFLTKLNDDFIVEKKGTANYKPQHLHEFSLYLDGSWYSLTARPGTYDDADAIGVLDVDISSRLILDKLMGIKDLRSDNRIDFVGGLRGLDELKKRVDSGECRWALALYPVSMQQIMNIADSGKIMPPKATWFEPKLRSGLVIHKLE